MKKLSKKLNGRWLIFFYGEPDSGKSTTLKEFALAFLRESDSYSDRRIMRNCHGNPISSSDREIMIEWRGTSIFIRTSGDSKNEVLNNINQFQRSNCAVGIVASRWESKVFQHHGFATKFIDISRIKNLEKANKRSEWCYTTANELYLHVLHLIKTGTFT